MPLPANVTTVTVLGTFLTPEGDPSTGTVSFTPSSWLLNSGANIAIPNSSVVKTLGTAGDFSAVLPITDDPDLSPGGWVYSVSEVVDGVSQSYNIAIPGTVAAGGTVFLADLAPVAPAGPEYYSLASSLAIGTVTTVATGGSATASITGLAPSQVLNLGIPTGATGTVASAGSGSVGTAAVAPQGDPDTGIYFPAANQVAITTGGTQALLLSGGAVANPTFTGQVIVPAGSASAPAISPTGDTNTGIFSSEADRLDFATGGATRVQIANTGLIVTGQSAQDSRISGEANTTDADGADVMRIAAQHTAALTSSTEKRSSMVLFELDGSTANHRGGRVSFYNKIDNSTTLSERLRIDSAGQVETGSGSAEAPVLSNLTDTNTGIFYPAADTVAITTGGTERLRVNSSGNVGIGASTIGARLHLSGGDQIIDTIADNSAAYIINFRKARGTSTIVASGDAIGQIFFQGHDGVTYQNAASIRGGVDATPGASDMPGRLSFQTAADGTTSLTERMRIDSNGLITGTGTSLGAWTAYTPTLTASTTNPTLGTGSTASGAYCQIGKVVHYRARIIFGTSGVAAGSGSYFVSLPVASTGSLQFGFARITDSSASKVFLGHAVYQSSSTVAIRVQQDSTGQATVQDGTPFTWAASDEIIIEGTYQAS